MSIAEFLFTYSVHLTGQVKSCLCLGHSLLLYGMVIAWPGLVNFIKLVSFVLSLPDWKVKFFGKFK